MSFIDLNCPCRPRVLLSDRIERYKEMPIKMLCSNKTFLKYFIEKMNENMVG